MMQTSSRAATAQPNVGMGKLGEMEMSGLDKRRSTGRIAPLRSLGSLSNRVFTL